MLGFWIGSGNLVHMQEVWWAYRRIGVWAGRRRLLSALLCVIGAAAPLLPAREDRFREASALLNAEGNDPARAEKAAGICREVLGENPQDARMRALLAQSLARFRPPQLEEALAEASRALAEAPRDSYVLATLGHLRRLRGQPGEALGCFRQALELEPGSAFARAGLYQTLRELGAWSVLAEEAQKTLKQTPHDRDAVIALADALEESGKLSAAAECLKTLLLEHPFAADAPALTERLEKLNTSLLADQLQDPTGKRPVPEMPLADRVLWEARRGGGGGGLLGEFEARLPPLVLVFLVLVWTLTVLRLGALPEIKPLRSWAAQAVLLAVAGTLLVKLLASLVAWSPSDWRGGRWQYHPGALGVVLALGALWLGKWQRGLTAAVAGALLVLLCARLPYLGADYLRGLFPPGPDAVRRSAPFLDVAAPLALMIAAPPVVSQAAAGRIRGAFSALLLGLLLGVGVCGWFHFWSLEHTGSSAGENLWGAAGGVNWGEALAHGAVLLLVFFPWMFLSGGFARLEPGWSGPLRVPCRRLLLALLPVLALLSVWLRVWQMGALWPREAAAATEAPRRARLFLRVLGRERFHGKVRREWLRPFAQDREPEIRRLFLRVARPEELFPPEELPDAYFQLLLELAKTPDSRLRREALTRVARGGWVLDAGSAGKLVTLYEGLRRGEKKEARLAFLFGLMNCKEQKNGRSVGPPPEPIVRLWRGEIATAEAELRYGAAEALVQLADFPRFVQARCQELLADQEPAIAVWGVYVLQRVSGRDFGLDWWALPPAIGVATGAERREGLPPSAAANLEAIARAQAALAEGLLVP